MSPITHARLTDVGLLAIRAMVGFVGIFHGAQKLFGAFGGSGIAGFANHLEKMGIPMPELSAWAAGIAEFGGGSLVLIGLLTRIAAMPFIFTMLVAYFAAHGGKFALQQGGGEYALTLAIVLLGLVLTGPGRLSVDAFLFRPMVRGEHIRARAARA
jgi:putative oxidoreductase